jgi:hypothetical protein
MAGLSHLFLPLAILARTPSEVSTKKMSAFAAENIESLLGSARYNASMTAFLARENSVAVIGFYNWDSFEDARIFEACDLNHSALNLRYSCLFRFCFR